jgi:transposase
MAQNFHQEDNPMLAFRFTLTAACRRQLNEKLKIAQHLGKIQQIKRVLAILSLADGATVQVVAGVLKVSDQAVRQWLSIILVKGVHGLTTKTPPGRPAKLTKTQKKELAQIIEAGPEKAGFPGACWRCPMIQHLIYEKYGVYYSVNYLSQLLKTMDFSYQKARFVSDHLDVEKRKEWLEKTWPEILKLAQEQNTFILFGDEASFPQWGTLSYTWARKGHQPQVPTSGKRKSYKVFGLVDYFTGRFFSQCVDGRLTSASYEAFLRLVLAQTRKHIILIQDGAKYHTSLAMRAFFAQHAARLTVFQLPAYSPDYNPIEKLWKNIKQQETHLHYFPTFESLIDKVDQALLRFENAPKQVLSLFGFYDYLAAA